VSVVRIFFAAAIFLVASASGVLAEAPKLALIITNRAYPASIGALENTQRDGERMAAAGHPRRIRDRSRQDRLRRGPIEQNRRKAAELILSAIKQRSEFTVYKAPLRLLER
jgi:hypothetical protein